MVKATLRKFNWVVGKSDDKYLETLCPRPNVQCAKLSMPNNMPIKVQPKVSHTSSLSPHKLISNMSNDLSIFPTISTVPSPSELEPQEITAPRVNVAEDNITEDSVQQMTLLSYEIRDQVQKEYLADTTTYRQYETYVRHYTDWWDKNEFSLSHQDPRRKPIPAFPITPAKVVHFLNYTMKRPKVSPYWAAAWSIDNLSSISALYQRCRNTRHNCRFWNATEYHQCAGMGAQS